MARTNPKQGKSFVRWFLKKIGLSAPASRRVSFHEQATVVEFERQLNGGGGVPDGDAVALGLGPRCIGTYLSPLSEKEDKDEYASCGYLPVDQRTKLLSEWHARPTMKAALDKARPEIERLQRSRDETAISPRDQRYMPSNMDDALMLASQDEEEAEAARISASQRVERRSRATNTRGARARHAGQDSQQPDTPTAAALALSSPIRKRKFL